VWCGLFFVVGGGGGSGLGGGGGGYGENSYFFKGLWEAYFM